MALKFIIPRSDVKKKIEDKISLLNRVVSLENKIKKLEKDIKVLKEGGKDEGIK